MALAASVSLGGTAGAANQSGLGFKGAVLGMSLAGWESLTPPAGAGPISTPTCHPATVAAPTRGGTLGAVAVKAPLVVCAYDTRFGHAVLGHSVRLDSHYDASKIRYEFAGGRLAEIRFDASIDAYNDVMAMLNKRYGRPTRTIRDEVRTSMGKLQRVRQIWRSPDGVVTLIDPSSDPVKLSVRITDAGAAA